MEYSSSLTSIKFTFLIVTAAIFSLIFDGLTAIQFFLLLGLCVLLALGNKGNKQIRRSLSIAYRNEVPPPAFGRRHAQLEWSFPFILMISAIYPLIAILLLLGIILTYSKPIFTWYRSEQDAATKRELAIERISSEPFDVIFYVAGPSNSAYQINQWLPVAERMSIKSAICVRNLALLEEIGHSTVPMFFAKSQYDIETIKDTSGASVFLYPANPQQNAQALRHSSVQHYFINHGESDKVVNQSKFLMAYDKILIAGPLAEQRLKVANLPLRDNQIEYVGRPQVDILLKKVCGHVAVQRILYAPTWEGFVDEADYSSVSSFGVSILEQILLDRKVEVVVKPHPFTGSRKVSTKEALKRMKVMEKEHPNLTVLGHEHKIYDQMNWCDLMIADIGSVVNDFLATAKPAVVTSVQGLPLKDLHTKFPTTTGTYVIDDPLSINNLINEISFNDPMAKIRSEVRAMSLGEFEHGSLAQFENVVKSGIKRL